MTRQRATVSEKKQRRTILTNNPFCSSLVRAQVDVMRRTAALVGAISLLTACSSGDIVVKTDLNESYVVKDSAVTNIESPIDRQIEYHKRDIETRRDFIANSLRSSRECSRSILSQAIRRTRAISDQPSLCSDHGSHWCGTRWWRAYAALHPQAPDGSGARLVRS